MRLASFIPVAIGAALIVAFFFRTPRLERDAPHAVPAPDLASDAALLPPETPAARDGTAAPDWTALRQRLDARAPALADLATQRDLNRIVARWLALDRPAALSWLDSHRGDARFDPIVASAAQWLVAADSFAEAQRLADTIVDRHIQEWAHQEAWAAAYDRCLVSETDLRTSGLAPDAIRNIASGSHRD